VDFPADPIYGVGTIFPIRMGELEDGCCSNGVPYEQYYININLKRMILILQY
jgi:hypothetical protein